MSSIPPVTPPEVVSSYTRTIQQGEKTIVTKIKHTEDRGRLTVDTEQFVTYNRKGEEVKPTPPSTLDKML